MHLLNDVRDICSQIVKISATLPIFACQNHLEPNVVGLCGEMKEKTCESVKTTYKSAMRCSLALQSGCLLGYLVEYEKHCP